MGGNFVTAKSILELTAYWYSHLQTVLEILLEVVYLVYRSMYNTVIVLRQVILSEIIYTKSMPLLCRL